MEPSTKPPLRAASSKGAFLWFVALLVIYHLNGRSIVQSDCVPAPYLAWSMLTRGSWDLRPYSYLRKYVGGPIHETADGRWISRKPPGAAVSAIPFLMPFAWFSDELPDSGTMRDVGKTVGAVYAAGCAAIFWVVCLRIAPSAATISTVLLALGSSLWSVASQALWMHGPATFWLIAGLAILLAAPPSRAWVVAAGFFLGMAVLTRPSVVFFLVAAIATMCGRTNWRSMVALLAGAAPPLALLLVYNESMFHSPIVGGYVLESELWNCPPWFGFCGLLVAPSRGLFVYSPALLLIPIGVWFLIRQGIGSFRGAADRVLIATCLAAFVATVALYAHWHDWKGGWCYGPRFLTECLPVLCLVFALAIHHARANWVRSIGQSLVAASVIIHGAGVFGYQKDWYLRHDRADLGRCLFSHRDSQIEAHFRNLLP